MTTVEEYLTDYRKNNIQRLKFNETPGRNTTLWELITYNRKTGNIGYSSGFAAKGRWYLPTVLI